MPKAFRRAGAAAPLRQPQLGALIPIADVPVERKTYGGVDNLRPIRYGRVYAPDGIYSQLLRDPSQIQDNIPQDQTEITSGDEAGQEVNEKRVEKNKRLWRKWSEETIPMLLKPYMELLEKTSGLRNLHDSLQDVECKGCGNGRLLKVSCVFFESTCSFDDSISPKVNDPPRT